MLTYSAQGEITDFYFCLNKLEMNAFMEGVAKEVRDSRIAQQILSFVENYRTAYNAKDTEYLRNVFSDDALIVTGRVITPRKPQSIEHGGFSAPIVAYTCQNKEQYLENLFALFKKVSYINVQFADIVVRQHPENPNFYAVTLKQDWHASNYSDEGIVNLLWEFEPTDYGLPLTQALQDSMKTLSVARIIEKAYEYTDAFDEENATLYWYIGALRGSAIAQTELGTCFFTGRGVPEAGFYKAFYWFQKAAVQGDSFALNNLGICYDEGKGVSQDITKAFECFEKAAMQNPDGGSLQCNLAKRYELGHGTPKNLKLAEEWYRKAAEKGNEEARIRLKNLLDSK